MATEIALAAAILCGAAMQRLTGMGFALIASPFLVLFMGVLRGIPLVQILSLCASTLVLISVWRQVEWCKAGLLIVPGLVGIVPGWWLSTRMSPPVLSILVGALVIAALLAMLADERARVFTGVAGLAAAGFLSGFMNVTAGVGGPAIVLYALSTRWRHAAFVATAQAYFIVLNIASLIAQGWLILDLTTWMVAFGSLLIGLAIGNELAKHVPLKVASALVIVIALAGALATIIRGVTALS